MGGTEKPTRPDTNMYLGKVEGSRLKGLAHYEHFKKQNPDATPADYARMQQALEDFDTWGLP